jgi:mannose/fructose-specific phosphotransferase system component IIA
MIGLVLVTHGRLAEELRHAMEHVVGPQRAVATVCIGPDDDMERRRQDIRECIASVDQGDGVVVLGDLGSAILTVRHVLDRRRNGHVRLVDAPLVEGAVAAAVTASAARPVEEVVRAAEEARGAGKL